MRHSECTFSGSVPEAVKPSLLVGGTKPCDLGGCHRRVEVAPQPNLGGDEALATFAGEDKVIVDPFAVGAQELEGLKNTRDEVDISPLSILWRAKHAAAKARPDARNTVVKVDVSPAKRDKLTLAHPRLERY